MGGGEWPACFDNDVFVGYCCADGDVVVFVDIIVECSEVLCACAEFGGDVGVEVVLDVFECWCSVLAVVLPKWCFEMACRI